MTERAQARRRRSRGFTLIEVLIAMLMIAFGLIGIASMQVWMMKGTTTSRMRTIASHAISDIADRMRANIQGYTAGSYLTTGDYGARAGSMPEPNYYDPTWITSSSRGMSPAQAAVRDVAVWQSAISDRLPGGAGFITGTAAAGFTVVVAWREPLSSAGDTANEQCPAAIAAPSEVRCQLSTVLP